MPHAPSAPGRPPSGEPGPAAGRHPGRVKIIAAAGLAVMAAVMAHPAAAQRKIATADVNLYVAPDGSDVDNDCLARSAPCRTPWHACVNAMRGWDYGGAFEPFVHLAAGLYRGGCNLAGQLVGAHTINIVGEQSEDQSCNLGQAARVVIEADAGQPAFYFQDLAIGVVRCLNVRGGAGFNCRQTPASDIAFVIFGGASRSSRSTRWRWNISPSLRKGPASSSAPASRSTDRSARRARWSRAPAGSRPTISRSRAASRRPRRASPVSSIEGRALDKERFWFPGNRSRCPSRNGIVPFLCALSEEIERVADLVQGSAPELARMKEGACDTLRVIEGRFSLGKCHGPLTCNGFHIASAAYRPLPIFEGPCTARAPPSSRVSVELRLRLTGEIASR